MYYGARNTWLDIIETISRITQRYENETTRIFVAGVQAPPRNDSVRLEPGPLVNGAGALYIAATCACALILVVGSVASALYIRNSKARIQESQ